MKDIKTSEWSLGEVALGSGAWETENRERIHPQNGPGTGSLEKIGTLARPEKFGRL